LQYNKFNNKKSPPEHKGKGFKPCHIHGKHTNHSYKECHANPRNQARYKLRVNNSNKKCRHESHFNNNCYTSSNDESCTSAHTPMPSDGNASASGKSKAEENFYLSEGKKNNKRNLSDVPSSSHSRKSSKKRCFSDINLDWDETFKVAFITEVEVADLKNGIQDKNPFAFDK
jgi:hypothetical protein